MFKAGDEPVDIMECSTGYWVHTSDGYLRDDKGYLIVFGRRECQIARARYLMNHGEEEKDWKPNESLNNGNGRYRKSLISSKEY